MNDLKNHTHYGFHTFTQWQLMEKNTFFLMRLHLSHSDLKSRHSILTIDFINQIEFDVFLKKKTKVTMITHSAVCKHEYYKHFIYVLHIQGFSVAEHLITHLINFS